MIFTGKLFYQIVHTIKGLIMKKLLPIIITLFIYTCGGKSSTRVAEDQIEYRADHKIFIESLLELNSELNADTLEARITKKLVIIDATEYYQISKVSLNNLGLSNLPPSINYLDSLTTLDISNNQLADLPNAICSLDIIDGTNFLFNDNLLCDASILPPCIIEIVDFTKQNCDTDYDEEDFQFIQEFIIMNDIDSISTEIFDNVTWVPSDSINDYSQHVLRIKKIEWNDKNISKIPEQIGFLDSLHWLELENNLIDTIPGTIGSLLSLEYLQLYNNKLTYLPESIGYLKDLRELYIHDNNLDTLSFSFEALTSLSEFWVQKNNLTSLPSSLCDLIDVSLPASAFYYYENNICILEDACNRSINEQICSED